MNSLHNTVCQNTYTVLYIARIDIASTISTTCTYIDEIKIIKRPAKFEHEN